MQASENRVTIGVVFVLIQQQRSLLCRKIESDVTRAADFRRRRGQREWYAIRNVKLRLHERAPYSIFVDIEMVLRYCMVLQCFPASSRARVYIFIGAGNPTSLMSMSIQRLQKTCSGAGLRNSIVSDTHWLPTDPQPFLSSKKPHYGSEKSVVRIYCVSINFDRDQSRDAFSS